MSRHLAAQELAAALGGAHRSGAWWRCRCPVHNSHGATLALRDGERGLVVHCHAGCPRGEVIAELRRLGWFDGAAGAINGSHDRAEIERRRVAEERDRRRRIVEAVGFWAHETLPAAGTVIERYWLGRRLALPIPPTVRASRSWLRHHEGGHRPAMVALVEHVEQGAVGIHRTWLAVNGSGKASFREPRRSLGPIQGGAVRLAAAADQLLIGEGIETTAAGMSATGQPGWAALSTAGMTALVLPPLPIAATVIILADNDVNGAGERAARTAARRWRAEGRRVRIARPPEPGTDFNDVLLGGSYARIAEARDAAT